MFLVMLSILFFTLERLWILLGFIFAEYGVDEIWSSMGLFTDGIGTLEIPLSYSLFFSSLLLAGSGR